MTVQLLIEKLQTLNPNFEVVIEENHGEFYPIHDENVSEGMITEDYYQSFEEDEGKKVVVVRV